MLMRSLFLITTLFLLVTNALCLPLSPRLVNYSIQDYKASNQNWAITQDPEGRMYFGNNIGILEFDGIHWTLHPLPNNDVVRSVHFSKDGKLYAGSYEEFGYFTRNQFNQLKYNSLKAQLSDYKIYNDEIWNIVEFNEKVYFQYFSSYFQYDGTSIKGYKGTAPLNFFKYNDRLYAQLINKGLAVYTSNTFKEVIPRKKYENDEIVNILPLKGNDLLITRNKGIFLLTPSDSTITNWNCSINNELKEFSVNKACVTKDSCYIIGTLSNGIYAINRAGQLLWKINEKNGLINNTVLGLFCDNDNNIWAALDNGIAKIFHNSDISIFTSGTHHFGMVYDALIMDKEFYIASNQGLYHYINQTGSFEKIPGTEGQAWSISKIDGQLICGHNTGSFKIENGRINYLSATRGGRRIIKCNIHNQDILLQSTYTFINVYRKDKNGEWAFSNKIDKFINLIENVEIDHAGNIWAEHMHKGIYQIKLNNSLTEADSVRYYNKLNKKEDIKINVFKILGRIVFSGDDGFYTYDDLNDNIIPYNQLNEDLPSLKNCYKVVSQNNSEYWFIDNTYYSLVKYVDGHFSIVRQIALSTFENSPIDNRGNVFFSENQETYLAFNGALAKYTKIKPFATVPNDVLRIKEIRVRKDDPQNGHYLPVENGGKINYQYNNINISLYCPSLKESSYNVRYQLDGLDNKNTWYTDIEALQKEYLRLPYGDYCFKAELYNDQRTLSAIQYNFTIQRPFYLSYIALFIYVILGIALLSLIILFISVQISKRKNKQIEQQQKLIIQLEKEQLESELHFKSKELAGLTMLNIKNKEFLKHIKEMLQGQKIKAQSPKGFIDNLIKIIDENISSDDDWAIFQSNFDRIHENFFRNLKKQYPELTSNDLRLCALLRLNLNTKDICNMMNISVRGIEAARYRLRKRLNIPTEQDLIDFMIQFK